MCPLYPPAWLQPAHTRYGVEGPLGHERGLLVSTTGVFLVQEGDDT